MKRFSEWKKVGKAQRGFTLIEIAIVIGIGTVLLYVVMKVIPDLLADNKSNGELQELPSIIANIQKNYSNAPTYAGATLDAVIRLNALPAERVTIPGAGAATATNRWGGTITMSVANLSATNDIVRLVYTNIGERACKSVIQGVAGLTRRIYVDSANGGAAGGGTIVKADGAALDIAALGTACGTGANSITYDLGK